MKCPKCSYLGFETGDRCRNCGYDFSLIADADPDPIEIDLDLRNLGPEVQAPSAWAAEMDAVLAAERQSPSAEPEPGPPPPVARAEVAPPPPIAAAKAVLSPAVAVAEPALPFFTADQDEDSDEPLIKLPATPRAPLAVRRTPATPRLRATPLAAVRPPREPVLEFEERRDQAGDDAPAVMIPKPATGVWGVARGRDRSSALDGEVGRPETRLAAAAVDYVLLGSIDLAVIYLTLRIAGLTMGEWSALPPVPLVAFLLFVKWSYFCAFTALGGQTIGKMAFRLRVVGDNHAPLDAALAVRRAAVGSLSAAVLGLGFLPAFFDPQRRALHDRAAHSRVIALPSA